MKNIFTSNAKNYCCHVLNRQLRRITETGQAAIETSLITTGQPQVQSYEGLEPISERRQASGMSLTCPVVEPYPTLNLSNSEKCYRTTDGEHLEGCPFFNSCPCFFSSQTTSSKPSIFLNPLGLEDTVISLCVFQLR